MILVIVATLCDLVVGQKGTHGNPDAVLFPGTISSSSCSSGCDQLQLFSSIINITGGIIKMANATWRKSGDSVSNMEFQYGNASILEVLGTFNITNGAANKREKAINYQSIGMEDVGSARGPIMVSGWLKETFRSIVTASGSSYSAEMICTDIHRMSVHVFTPKPEFEEEKKISVEVERRGDAFILNTPFIDHISIITGAPQMSEDDMEEAVESPSIFGKRGPPDAAEEADSTVFTRFC